MKKYMLYVGMLAMLLLSSCNDKTTIIDDDDDDGDLEQVFSVRGLNGGVSAEGVLTSVYVNSTQAWTVSMPEADKTWLSLENTSGKSSLTVLLDVKVNPSVEPRETTLTFSAENGETKEVKISQYGQLILSPADLSGIAGAGATIPVSVTVGGTYSVTSSPEWVHTSIDGGILTVTVDPNPELVTPRRGRMEIAYNGDAVKVLAVEQNQRLAYADFIGTYTMRYMTSNTATPINRNQSATVTLVQNVEGTSYLLKGVLAPADESLGKIIVNYVPGKGINMLSQILFTRTTITPNLVLRWMPHSANNYLTTTATAGVESTQVNMDSGKLSFYLTDNGVWGSYVAVGFVFYYYTLAGSTSAWGSYGVNNHRTFYHLQFEKQ